MEPKVKRAQELRTQLAARDRRDEKRRKHAVELAAALPPILARLRPRYRPPYLDQVRQVAATDPEASLEAADTLLDLLNGERVSPEGAAEWVDRGLEVLERNKEVGRGYFRLGSKYSLQVLEELKEGLALKSVARVLKLYATALSGHEVAIRGTNELQAVDAYGADHIILPPEMRFFEDDEGNFTAYKVATAHGAGRIEFGTYEFSLADIPETVERLRVRYAAGDSAEHPAPRSRPTSPASTRSSPSRRWRGTCSTSSRATASTAAIRRTYPGIRRDMAMIQTASAERRPEHGHPPRRPGGGRGAPSAHPRPAAGPARGCAPATQALIGRAVGDARRRRAGRGAGRRRRRAHRATSTT